MSMRTEIDEMISKAAKADNAYDAVAWARAAEHAARARGYFNTATGINSAKVSEGEPREPGRWLKAAGLLDSREDEVIED
ncbi:hypothetical protein [Limimaricola cinnabarinus]|uniref:hypothetical protein n=1 Tax=Limimaricola cinnabarinus TaxID=1125964 RepID=UPI002FE3AF77